MRPLCGSRRSTRWSPRGGARPALSTPTVVSLIIHVLPAMGEVRLGEATTPLVDKVVGAIKSDVSAATARVPQRLSGVMGLAVRYGAVLANPVREVERIESKPKRQPRALTLDERVELLKQLNADEKARRRDLPDLVFFMLATGVRIGEALAAVWSEVDFAAGTVQVTSTLVRVKGEGLLRKGTKSRAGERTLPLPETAVAMLRRRFMTGARLDQPLFPMCLWLPGSGQVRRELRDARGHEESHGSPRIPSGRRRRRSLTRPHCRLVGCRSTRSHTAVDDSGCLHGAALGGLPSFGWLNGSHPRQRRDILRAPILPSLRVAADPEVRLRGHRESHGYRHGADSEHRDQRPADQG